MHNLGYILQFTMFSETNGIQRFQVPNAFDNIHIDLHMNDGMGERANPVIHINGRTMFVPNEPYGKETHFYDQAHRNPDVDKRYRFNDVQGLLTGTSPVAAHLAADSHFRLTQYDPFEEHIRTELLNGSLTDGQYADLRYQAQMYTNRKFSVIGQNLSEFPPFGKSSAAQKATRDAVVNGEKEIIQSRLQHRPETDNLAKILRGVGTGIVVVSAATSVYRVVTSDNKMETAGNEAGSWGGAIVGGEAGMHTGAVIGGSIGVTFFGAGFAPGAAIGGFIGGIADGIGGSIWGLRATKYLQKDHHLGFGGGKSSGGGASGGW